MPFGIGIARKGLKGLRFLGTRGGTRLFKAGSKIKETLGASKFFRGSLVAGASTSVLAGTGLIGSTLLDKSSEKLSKAFGELGIGEVGSARANIDVRRTELELQENIQDLSERRFEFQLGAQEKLIKFYESAGISTEDLIAKGPGHPTVERQGGGFELFSSPFSGDKGEKKGSILPLLVVGGLATALIVSMKKKKKK